VLDLGCGNSPYRQWMKNVSAYVPYDADASSMGAQIVGSAQSLPFSDSAFDSLLCTQVLEHVERPWLVLDEIARVSRPGSFIVLSAPQAWRIHEAPYDYFRFTKYGMEALLKRSGLMIVDCVPQGGAWLLIGQTINNHLWHKKIPRGSVTWYLNRTFTTIATLCVNIGSSVLDKMFHDPDETLNYVVIAYKK
jgi:SAM-dependent methyltransferase